MGRSKEEEEEGEQTRFPCLALVRSLVAAGVTTLAVVVVVMVIVVLHRPEKIIVTSSGYVQTQDLWWEAVVEADVGIAHTQNVRVTSHDHDSSAADFVPSGPAKLVRILVIVFAYNPSGRGEVNCTTTSISIIDMPNGHQLASIDITDTPSLVFTLPPQTWHMHICPVNITDKRTLKYLYDNHADEFRFNVMVRVNMTQLSGHKPIDVTYNCWPVLVVYGAPADIPDSEVYCKTGEEMDYSFPVPVPVPVPAPAPAPAP